MAALDGARGLWVSRHPYASRRWLQATRAVVGDEITRRALAWLIRCHGHEPGYLVKRSDMTLAVRIGREEHREAACHAEGFRLSSAAVVGADPLAGDRRRSDTRAQNAA